MLDDVAPAVDRVAILQTLSPVHLSSGGRSLRVLSPRVSLDEFAVVLSMMSADAVMVLLVVNSIGFR
jgi:hypothetical protein